MSASRELDKEQIASLIRHVRQNISIAQPPPSFEKVSLGTSERIVQGKFPSIELLFEDLCRQLRVELSRSLGAVFDAKVLSVSEERVSSVFQSLSSPANLHIFSLPPLPGEAVLMFGDSLVDQIVDFGFGGNGENVRKHARREYTAIERRVMAKHALCVLDVLSKSLSKTVSLDARYKRAEEHTQSLVEFNGSDKIVRVRLCLSCKSSDSSLEFFIPRRLLNPLCEMLGGAGASARDSNPENERRLRKHLLRTSVPVAAILGRGKILTKDIFSLKVGDFIPLDSVPKTPISVEVGGREKFRATVGEKNGSRAVMISSVSENKD